MTANDCTSSDGENGSGENRVSEETNHDLGVSVLRLERREGFVSSLELGSVDSGETTIRVEATDYDDEGASVSLDIGMALGSLWVELSPEEARELCRDLEVAAEHRYSDEREDR